MEACGEIADALHHFVQIVLTELDVWDPESDRQVFRQCQEEWYKFMRLYQKWSPLMPTKVERAATEFTHAFAALRGGAFGDYESESEAHDELIRTYIALMNAMREALNVEQLGAEISRQIATLLPAPNE